MFSIYILREKYSHTCHPSLGEEGGGGGSYFTWEPFESALSKITKYFAFCIFIVVQLLFQLELKLELELELESKLDELGVPSD